MQCLCANNHPSSHVNTMSFLTPSNLGHDKAASIQFLQQRNIIHMQCLCANNHPPSHVNTMSFLTLSNLGHDKAASIQFLQQRNIIHMQCLCANNHPMVLQLRVYRGDRWRCNIRECRSELSLRTGTWLEGSRISCRDLAYTVGRARFNSQF